MASRYSGFAICAITIRINHCYALVYLALAAPALAAVAALGRANT